MMRICFINPTRLPKTVVFNLARHLSKRNFYGVILQPIEFISYKKASIKENVNNFKIINFPCFFIPRINYTIPYFPKQLNIISDLAIKKEIDIIQVADYFYPTSLIPIYIKKRYNIPIILTVNAIPGYSWFYGNTIVDSLAKIYTYTIGKIILNFYDKIIPIYQTLSNEIINFGVDIEKVYMIPNGVDYNKFNKEQNIEELKQRWSIKDDEKVLLFVGRLVQVKRVDILIKITIMLLKKGFKIKTIIVGDGPMKKIYENLSIPFKNNIIFTGHIQKKELPKFYQLADIFVLPSLSEGLPNVILEAAAAGTTSVATSTGGISDIIRHEENGFLVKHGNINSFYHYIKMLIQDEELLKMMGEKIKTYVNRNFNWSIIIKKYIELYKNLSYD